MIPPPDFTRRAVLRGAAVAGAAALVRPAAGLGLAAPASAGLGLGAPASAGPGLGAPASAGPGLGAPASAGVFSVRVGVLRGGETRALTAPRAFSLAGVAWVAPDGARIEMRTRGAGSGGWSRWVTASVGGHGPDRPAAATEHFGEPIWTGPAVDVQVRSAVRVEGVALHFVAPADVGGARARARVGARVGARGRAGAGVSAAHSAQALPLAQPILDAGPGQPPIIARGAWAHGHAPPRHVPEYGTVKLAFVHHSESPNGYAPAQVPAILHSIFIYHRYVRGYFDIGYNFAVDDFGRIWEARAGGIDQAVIGAHAGGYNTESTGVVVLGSFTSVAPPPAALRSLARLLAWKLSLHGVPALGRVPVQVSADGAAYTPYAAGAHVSLPRIAGHRDGDQTSCPGDALYARLPAIRPRVAALAGTPARLSISAPAAAVGPSTAVTVTGVLTDLHSGAPIAGAPLEVEQIGGSGGETTIATLTTAPDGTWSYTATPAQNTLLRAVHRAAPAAVSDVVALEVAPVLTLTLVSAVPLTVTGTVSPAGPHVSVELYRIASSRRRRLVASKQLAATGGSFHARLTRPGPGRYMLIARTAASARYAAATAPVVPLTV